MSVSVSLSVLTLVLVCLSVRRTQTQHSTTHSVDCVLLDNFHSRAFRRSFAHRFRFSEENNWNVRAAVVAVAVHASLHTLQKHRCNRGMRSFALYYILTVWVCVREVSVCSMSSCEREHTRRKRISRNLVFVVLSATSISWNLNLVAALCYIGPEWMQHRRTENCAQPNDWTSRLIADNICANWILSKNSSPKIKPRQRDESEFNIHTICIMQRQMELCCLALLCLYVLLYSMHRLKPLYYR